MSQNVSQTRESKALIVLPQKDEKVVNSKHEQDWDEIAGITGALQGNSQTVLRLKPVQYRALSLLLQGKSQIDVANELGVTRKSVSRWMKMGNIFREILMECQYKLWESTKQQLRNSYSKAARVLNELLENPDEKIRLQAATTILKHVNFDKPFNPNDIPEDLAHDYDQKKDRNEYYYGRSRVYGYSSVTKKLNLEESNHTDEQEFDDYISTEEMSFTLQPDALESFAEQLDGKVPKITIDQDVIYVLNYRDEVLAEIYSVRAERKSVFHIENFNRGEPYKLSSTLNIDVRDPYKLREPIIIPSETAPDVLIELLSNSGHCSWKKRDKT